MERRYLAYIYSREGINLLQFVVEEGAGVDVGEYMATHLFQRFGMSRTSLVWRNAFADNVALGYD
ncbi:hypothetical protein DWU98_12310 [Dyella monticola]|uniref:Uncharacterized protein n=1 Tax=Dyella monticola TaxID=1927958 RepID=A0A370WXF2_9GAMM|nr:serine hydrolase [Dyella monticola]RDS80736.1 hypothetical protein DWU98_12310 [Dyella monticola]